MSWLLRSSQSFTSIELCFLTAWCFFSIRSHSSPSFRIIKLLVKHSLINTILILASIFRPIIHIDHHATQSNRYFSLSSCACVGIYKWIACSSLYLQSTSRWLAKIFRTATSIYTWAKHEGWVQHKWFVFDFVSETRSLLICKLANQNVPAPALTKQGNSQVGNSAYILASLHDSSNSLTSINQGIVVKTANGGPIKAGQANQLVLSSGTKNFPLKGALLYAQDNAGVRQGSFSDKSGANTFVAFPGCGKNPQGQISGVIQQMGVSASVSQQPPKWKR